MTNYFKRNERYAFSALLVLTFAVGGLAVYGSYYNFLDPGKLAATCGLLATLTGVVQLEVAGLFNKLFDEYGNEKKYPYGPPSHITREIIDKPDTPDCTWLHTYAFFKVATGFWLIVGGTLIQIAAVWL